MRLLALLMLAAWAAAEEVPLRKATVRGPMHRGYPVKSAVEKPAARQAKVGAMSVVFFDVDGNGRFDDWGVDGWTLAKMRHILPLEKKVVLGGTRVTWKIDGDKLVYDFKTISASPDVVTALMVLNTWRITNGVPPVDLDPELSADCLAHAKYMAHHGMVGHAEDPKKELYSPGGDAAGRASCCAADRAEVGVQLYYASFFHRLPLMHPDTRAVGIGGTARRSAVDGVRGRKKRAWTSPLIVPAPDSEGHPTAFSRESPNPVPKGITAGFPITLTFAEGRVAWPRVELRVKSKKGARLDVKVSSPDRPASVSRPNNVNSICILPLRPLKPRTLYWVRVRYKHDGEKKELTWSFKTGRSRVTPPPK